MIDIKNGLYKLGGFQLAIDLKVERAEFCAVLGPSGAGKSTLLSVIAGFENLQRGELYLDGKAMFAVSAAHRPVSMVFQDHNVFSHLTVFDNVGLGISPRLHFTAEQYELIEGTLRRVGISHLAARLPAEISGGERQRIAVARALVRNRPILLLDEPFAALDPGLRGDMLHLVRELQREQSLTVLLVTHQPDEAHQAADKIIYVDEERVRDAQTIPSFFAADDPAIARYLGPRR